MSSKGWTLALGAVALFLVTLPSAAQEGRNPPEVAALPEAPLNGDNATSTRPRGGPAGPARDYRAIWADPAIMDFVGPAENAWDFSKPDSIPGFGSLPHQDSVR